MSMKKISEHELQVRNNIERISKDKDFLSLSNIWTREAIKYSYAFNFTWLGRPIIQIPQDIYAIQELIWSVKPDLIVETGIAHGGSLIMSASMLALLDYSDAVNAGVHLNPKDSKRKVIGVDIDIRKHNEEEIKKHPMAHMISMMQGSSIDANLVSEIKLEANQYEKILVFLDSNHTHQHVLEELKLYAPLVTMDSYCVVWDTGVEDLPEGSVKDRPWGKGNNPKTAVWEFLDLCGRDQILADKGKAVNFEIDKVLEHKLSITASPDGFLRRSR